MQCSLAKERNSGKDLTCFCVTGGEGSPRVFLILFGLCVVLFCFVRAQSMLTLITTDRMKLGFETK